MWLKLWLFVPIDGWVFIVNQSDCLLQKWVFSPYSFTPLPFSPPILTQWNGDKSKSQSITSSLSPTQWWTSYSTTAACLHSEEVNPIKGGIHYVSNGEKLSRQSYFMAVPLWVYTFREWKPWHLNALVNPNGKSGWNGRFRHEMPKVVPQILTRSKWRVFPQSVDFLELKIWSSA